MEKRLVYTENDPEFKSYYMYAGKNAKLYSNYHLYGEELMSLYYDQAIKVLADLEDSICTVSIDGMEAAMERRFIRMDGEEPYEVWDGYSGTNTKIYDNIYLLGSSEAILVGEEATVPDEFENCCLVRVKSTGMLGYVQLDGVGIEPPVYNDYSGGSESRPDWTDPLL